MQIDNGMCKCGTFKAGALTKNKGVLRFWTEPCHRWRLHKKTMVPRCFQWNMVAEEEEASGLRGASMFASVSGRPRHAGLETCAPKPRWPTAGWEACATTIGRANPKIAGSRPGGIHARRRAWARLTRRQPPHARARALPETNPAATGRSPIPLEIAKSLLWPKFASIRVNRANRLGTRGR